MLEENVLLLKRFNNKTFSCNNNTHGASAPYNQLNEQRFQDFHTKQKGKITKETHVFLLPVTMATLTSTEASSINILIILKQRHLVFSRVKASRKMLTELAQTFNGLRHHNWVAGKGDILCFPVAYNVGHYIKTRPLPLYCSRIWRNVFICRMYANVYARPKSSRNLAHSSITIIEPKNKTSWYGSCLAYSM